MKLIDDIYIKMNFCGKLFIDFEYFKVEFLKVMCFENDDEVIVKCIGFKIDCEWIDLFWIYRDEYNFVDSGFLNFFCMIFFIFVYKLDCFLLEFDLEDDFSLLERFYKN